MAEAPTVNIWENLLRESSSRSRLGNGLVIFFGDENCGKSKLLDRFCLGAESEEKQYWNLKEIISYDFFNALDPDEIPGGDLESNLVGIWSFNNHTTLGGDFEANLMTTKNLNVSVSMYGMIERYVANSPIYCIVRFYIWLE